jgi:hypothetical protein
MVEQALPAPITPEIPNAAKETLALQARLLLGKDALNPAKVDVENATKERLETGIGAADAIEKGSQTERQEQYPSGRFAENKQIWAGGVTDRFQNYKAFWEGSKGKQWQETFTRIGIDITALNTDALYAEYFSQKDTPPTQRFVEKVLSSYKKADGTVDLHHLNADKEALIWMGGLFGKNTSEILAEFIHAKALVATKPDAFVKEINTQQNNTTRLNDLTEKEKQLLKFIQTHTSTTQKETPIHIMEDRPQEENRPQEEHRPQEEDRPQEENRPQEEDPALLPKDHDMNISSPLHYVDSIPSEENEENIKPLVHPEARSLLAHQALRLINYETGKITNEIVDLSESFPALVENVTTLLQNAEALDMIPEGTVVLSDVARTMIDKLAEEANRKNLELSFVLQGQWVRQGDKEVFVAAYPVPAMDYSQLRQISTDIVPEIHRINSAALAEQTNLKDYFSNTVHFANGESGTMCHVHQESLGEQFRANPSGGDYNQISLFLRAEPNVPHSWSVVTKAEGNLYMRILYSSTENGRIQHATVDPLSESDLDSIMVPQQQAA